MRTQKIQIIGFLTLSVHFLYFTLPVVQGEPCESPVLRHVFNTSSENTSSTHQSEDKGYHQVQECKFLRFGEEGENGKTTTNCKRLNTRF